MSSRYPSQIDSSLTLPIVTDNFSPVSGSVINSLREAIINVEAELGIKPSGTGGTVRARLEQLDTLIGNFASAGDISGNLNTPLVIGLQGNPISSATPSINQALVWNGAHWAPANVVGSGGGGGDFIAGGDLSGTSSSQTVIKINGATVPAAGSLTTGHVLQVSGTSATTYGYITNSNVDSSAAISYSKLNLSGSIVNADINNSAAIAYSKLDLVDFIVNTDINSSAAIAGTKIDPDFGSQNITTTGVITLGASAATDGKIRLPYNGVSAVTVIGVKDSSNNDRKFLTWGAGDLIQLGEASRVFDITTLSSTINLNSTTHNIVVGAGHWTLQDFSANNLLQINTSTPAMNIGLANVNYLATVASPTIKQADDSTGSATGDALTIQAQNATGATSTGGALVLTSGTGTSINGSVRLQVAGSDVLTLAGNSTITNLSTQISSTGNARIKAHSDIANVQTTDTTTTTLFSWTIAPEATTVVTAEVLAVNSDASKTAVNIRRVRIKNDGGVNTAGTVEETYSDEEASFDLTVTIDIDGISGRVRVTGIAATTIDWGAVITRLELTHA